MFKFKAERKENLKVRKVFYTNRWKVTELTLRNITLIGEN